MIRFDDILEKVSSLYSEKDITRLKKAYVFAARAHKGQIRRSGEPYLSHPLEVAWMLSEMKLDCITLAAGLLHDVLEDTDVTADDLKKNFGKEITDLVEGVTKISRVQESSPEKRHAESIRKIILAMTDDLRVIFIKLADRVHNLKTLKFLPENKQKLIALETLEIYVPIANRLGMGRIKAELEDLSFRYVTPEEYFKMASLLEPRKKKAEKEIKKIKRTLVSLMKENKIPAEIFARIKRLYSVYNKMKHQNIDFDQVYDFMAIRIITDSVKNCYAALGFIHQKWPHFPHRFRDLISMPKPNLYQALHTTIITENKQTIEIQIRTQAMHNMAENGISALKTGDIVEILTSPEKKPSRDWLNKASTSKARHHIKHWFKQQDKIKNSALGKKLWEKKIKEYRLPAPSLKKEKLLKRLSEETPYRVPDIAAFYLLIGSGKVVLNKKFIENLFLEKKYLDKKETILEKMVAKVAKKPKPLIEVKEADEAIINLAKCCAPIRGEPIIGYITSGKGVTVHAQRCPLVKKEILDLQRMVDASWSSSSAEASYQGKILIKSHDSPGVLAQLTAAIAEQGGNITKAQVDTYADKKAQIKLTIIIRDIKHLEQIIKKILGIKEVSFVERV